MPVRLSPARLLAPLALFAATGGALAGPPAATPAASPAAPPAAAPAAGWLALDYRALVDLRQPTHSGEPVGLVLERLGGRPRPAGPGPLDAGDVADHALVDPLLEPFAFVLTDAAEAAAGPGGPGFVEFGALYPPGAAEPAWVELVRSRRYLLEGDGRGRVRAFVPWAAGEAGGDGARVPVADEIEATKTAWAEAWPVVRHALAAERRRAGRALEVEVRAYAHFPARTRFLLGARPQRVTVDATPPDGRRAPLDLAAWQRFLGQGLTLEGARLDPDGGIVLFGSPAAAAPAILGRPLSLADAAVAYRAVFHGGAAEPYMSLDRGFAPQTALVNYGGRLQDTGLGMVSLLCDARFKTFSQGIDIVEGQDLRERVRAAVPGFRTHLERFAADAGSKGLSGQQTRLWFYPDTVELTLSAEGDLLAMRRARMAAASEKVQVGPGEGAAAAAPWTKATVDEINRDYDGLARLFPELGDLDQAVRWLSLFTWLRVADRAGLAVPELDALLAIELPATPTPRTFPQLLAFNAVPENPGPGAVDVFERVDVVAALDRLAPPAGRPLPAADRLRRALDALDRRDPQQAALAAELAELSAASATDTELDAAAFRAERLRMHQLVLGTLPEAARARLRARAQAGDPPRVFSVGIGGLDLGMGSSLARAAGRGGGLSGLGAGAHVAAPSTGSAARPEARPAGSGSSPAPLAGARAAWQQDPAGLPAATLPPLPPRSAAKATTAWPAAYDARYRRAEHDAAAGGALVVVRVEGQRALRYRVEPGGAIAALPFEVSTAPAVPEASTAAAARSDDLLLLERVGESTTAAGLPAVVLRLSAAGGRPLEAPFPRAVLQRLVLGRGVDLMPDRPLPGFSQLPPALAALTRTMVILRPEETQPPWVSGAPAYPGEESTARLARALASWWAGTGRTAVAGIDASASPARWQSAPRPRAGAALLLPDDAFPLPYAALAPTLRGAWKNGPAVTATGAPADGAPGLLVLVSAEGAAPLAARALKLAQDPAMKGKLLAVLSLAAPLRVDLAARLLEPGQLAGVGLAEWGGVGLPEAVRALAALDAALAALPGVRGGSTTRVEDLPGPFAWTF